MSIMMYEAMIELNGCAMHASTSKTAPKSFSLECYYDRPRFMKDDVVKICLTFR